METPNEVNWPDAVWQERSAGVKRMKINVPNLTMLLLLALCFGCQTTFFHADFEHDTVGQPPSRHPPGPPTGDGIAISAIPSTDNPAIVIEDGAINGERSLRYSNIDIDYWARAVTFIGKRYGLVRRTAVFARWSGRLDGESPGTPALRIDVGDPHFSATLFIEDGAFRVPDDSGGHERVGSVDAGQVHRVFVGVYPRTFSLLIVQGRETYLVAGRPTSSRGIGRHPFIALTFERGHSNASYVIDDIKILRQEPREMTTMR